MASVYKLKDLGASLTPGAQIIKSAEFSAVETAQQILADAQEQANAVLEHAKEVYEEQKKLGYEDGVRKAQAEAAERLVREHAHLDKRLREAEQDVVAVVITLLRRLLDEYDDAERVRLMARSMLNTLRSEKRVRLLVPPQMYSHAMSMTKSIMEGYKQVEFLEVVEDADLEGTHIVLEAPIGRVDGNLTLRLQEIEQMLRQAVSAPTAPAAGEGA